MIDFLSQDVEIAFLEAENRRLRWELHRTRKALQEAQANNVTGAENARLRSELARERKDLVAALQRLGACTCGKENRAKRNGQAKKAWWV